MTPQPQSSEPNCLRKDSSGRMKAYYDPRLPPWDEVYGRHADTARLLRDNDLPGGVNDRLNEIRARYGLATST